MENKNLNTIQAAKFLCVSLSKLMMMCHKKQVKYYKVGRLNVFKEDDLMEYLEKNKVLPVEELQNVAEAKVINTKRSGRWKI